MCEGVKKGQGHIVLCSLCSLRTKQGVNSNSQSGEAVNCMFGNLFAFVSSIVLIKLKWIISQA